MDFKFAERLSRIVPSPTAELFRRVAELRAQGVELVSLAFGEPDFDPPTELLDAARRALDTGPYGYTTVSGLASLRAAICARAQERRGLSYQPDQVVVTAGAKHALFQLAQVLYDEGDEVIIPTPSWVSYADQARLCGATPKFVPCAEAQGFLPDSDALEAAIGPRTRALILCDPNNPTGAVCDVPSLERLAEMLRRHPSMWVILDEIYAELTYDGGSARSLLSVAPDLRERAVIVDGVSKTYAMTGFRVGWLLAPHPLARACEMLQSQSTTSIATIAQLTAQAALTSGDASLRRMLATYVERRDRLLAGLRRLPGVQCTTPRGAFYVFADVRAWLGKRVGDRVLASDIDVADWLLSSARVAVVPGSAFGGPGYLRLSYAASLADIDAALERMRAAVLELR